MVGRLCAGVRVCAYLCEVSILPSCVPSSEFRVLPSMALRCFCSQYVADEGTKTDSMASRMNDYYFVDFAAISFRRLKSPGLSH